MSTLKVGLAQVDITPQEPIRMGGYGARVEPSVGVLDPLMAKALALEDAQGERGVIITTDLIGIDAAFADVVCADIGKQTGLERRQIIINSSHTHAGPIFGIRYQQCWELTPEQIAAIERYNTLLRRRMVEVVAGALADLKPATLSWAVGSYSAAMNRRKPTPTGVKNAPNPRGYVDRSVPTLRVADEAGRLRGLMFGYACHNTTLGGTNRMISADYAGFAYRYLELRHPGVQAMFLMGCGADANPYPRGTYDMCRQRGESLGAEVRRLLEEECQEFQPVRGPLRIAFDHVDMPLEPQPTQEHLDAMRKQGQYYAKQADRIQAMIDSGKPWATHYRSPIAVWQFGEDLTLVRLSGEVVGHYIRLIERTIGPLNLWIAGYCADYFGYLPSARIHREGGYESHDFITGWGFLDVSVEKAVLAKVRALAKRAGRPLPNERAG
ncbi:MAG: neutral/alkaline non-lysosomal ceramidase N-terminal domain-containing protein [Planctomycetota bacterium]